MGDFGVCKVGERGYSGGEELNLWEPKLKKRIKIKLWLICAQFRYLSEYTMVEYHGGAVSGWDDRLD